MKTARTKWYAKCSTCSWVGRSYASKTAAEHDGDDHQIAVGTNQQHHNVDVKEERTP